MLRSNTALESTHLAPPARGLGRALLALALLVTWGGSQGAEAGSVSYYGGGGVFSVPVKSLKERKFLATRRQQYDFSCGSAALATLLSFHYEDRKDEATIFEAMYEAGDKEKIRQEGFSLLDMKNYLETNGYRADGFKVSLEHLKKVGVPAIALINEKGYKHFIVVKGVSSTEVLIGDPFKGSRLVNREDFDAITSGLFFIIRNKKDVGQRHFNQDSEWRSVKLSAVSSQGLPVRGTSDFSLVLRGLDEF